MSHEKPEITYGELVRSTLYELKRIADALEARELHMLLDRPVSMPQYCPGHVGHPKQTKICRYCGTTVDEERPD